MSRPVVSLRGIKKSFPGVQALKGVDLEIHPGEVVGLLGENGAGKSTLMKILSGVYAPDEGEILWEGRPVQFQSVFDAQRQGISIIFQEFNLCPNTSVLDNLFLGREVSRGLFLDYRKMREEARGIFSYLDVDIPLDRPVGELSVALQQMVEIAKALLMKVRVLIMDEPTSALTEKEIAKLFQVIRDLKEQGISVIFISHKLEEVLAITDRVVVLRDGERVGETPTREATEESLVRLMVGRELSDFFSHRRKKPQEEVVLEVEGLSGPPYIEDVGFTLRRGEILGVAGLIGAGRTETALLLIGAVRPTAGTIRLNGERVEIPSPADAVSRGLVYLSEDRKNKSLILEMSVRENMSISVLDRLSEFLHVINRKKEDELCRRYIDLLQVKTSGPSQRVKNLSGGNQQKVVIARCLAAEPLILILDEPTRGIDVNAKAEVHRIITELADNGVSIMLISSELPEILALSDRVLVMHEGRVRGVLENDGSLSQEDIMNTILRGREEVHDR
ncbi:sugar ABC transporter ATP-binding protein [Spirochaeta thermophila]|uniref:Ribose import ATP-binding protein RbsA n=1 Tax=Winmispira thermophila (strain ATCC 49972 / DSM 6192 / RI 19.B1) TaxID=665571 RepID=E0RQT2_WINT6|nr:sugar ABC transporter ATP-binding protein [Spirochaeta thermophila]ADN02988.1 ribose import ATP-binding protein RbsA [Spirochaeta thermophila DSM 6192]